MVAVRGWWRVCTDTTNQGHAATGDLVDVKEGGHTYTHTHLHMHTHLYTHLHICTFVYSWTHNCKDVHVHIYTP